MYAEMHHRKITARLVGRSTSFFGKYGIEIIGKISDGLDRAQEIRHWLDGHPDVERYVILDDSPFGWGELAEHLVQTGGLQDSLDNRTTEMVSEELNSIAGTSTLLAMHFYMMLPILMSTYPF